MSTETKIQEFVHAIEEGGWVKYIRLGLLLALTASVAILFLIFNFKGLSHEKGMEQAQIARELARGNGFSTKCVRPAALAQFDENKISVPEGAIPDTYHAPLGPLVNAPFIWLARSTWPMTKNDIVYTCDRIIACVSMIFFFLGVLANYWVVKRLFDQQIAVITAGFTLLSLKFWNLTVTGLPQMLLFFLFGLCAYALVRAMEARDTKSSPAIWLMLSAVGFGLLALTHGITLWVFVGALAFVAIYFQKRVFHLGIMIVIVLALYSPWMIRNYKVSGNPTGTAAFSALFQLRGTENEIMRSMPMKVGSISPLHFRTKIQRQTIGQFSNIYDYLGSIIAAPVFFVSLLHLFRRPIAAAFRWCVLLMWLGAVFGMSALGFPENGIQANDIHILFSPLLSAYGTAFLLVLWSRLEIHVRLVRLAFIVFLLFFSGFPLLHELTTAEKGRVQWPPYVPPYIAILSEWTNSSEIIMSDMPWAVAWYADRKSLWMPLKISDYVALNDYNQLHGNIAGIYLTPITGNSAFVSAITKGEWKDWAPFIKREVTTSELPLKASTALPINYECIFYADRDRWSTKVD